MSRLKSTESFDHRDSRPVREQPTHADIAIPNAKIVSLVARRIRRARDTEGLLMRMYDRVVRTPANVSGRSLREKMVVSPACSVKAVHLRHAGDAIPN